MYVFSLTAPRITDEEDLKEAESLDAVEAAAVERDLRGQISGLEEPGLVETESIRIQGMQELANAIEMLPETAKAAYLHALVVSPDVVERETNPLDFLRLEDWDPWKAATRLTSYWSMRSRVFGEKRAFLPMTVTGNGALSDGAVEQLALGVWLLSDEKDDSGRSIIYYDRPKINNISREFIVSNLFACGYNVRS